MNIGSKIKELRLGKSITQEQLANYLSVSTQCVSKWENNVTMPDIQMLPLISAFFGVTIDELFDLTDDIHITRIEAMIETKRLLDYEEFQQAEKFLTKKEYENPINAKYKEVLSALYNHMADGYRYMAEIKAKKAIELEPEKKYHHTLLRMAEQGNQIDWNFENHTKRIDYYFKFVSEHSVYDRGYVCLIDELIAANRFDEAEQVICKMDKNVPCVKSSFYMGYIKWVKNERNKAHELWQNMLTEYKEDWQAYALLGDCMASYCEYEQAITYYEKSLELQNVPRYTDSQISVAMIYEIIGNKDKAKEAWQKVLDILKNEHHIEEGWFIEKTEEEIRRLNSTN